MASSSASRLSALAAPFTITRPPVPQQQLYASSSAMDDFHYENPYSSSSASSMVDSFSGLGLDDTDYGVDIQHHSGMLAAEGSQPCIGTSVHRDYNENSSGYVASSLKRLHAALNGGVIEKGKELEDYIFVQSPSTSKDEFIHQKDVADSAIKPLPIEKYDLLVTHPNLTNFAPDLPSADRGVSAKNSSEQFNKDDSDLDSPCWKGTLGSRSSPFAVEVSGRMTSPPPKTELEVYKSLNPLAPKFIPGNAIKSTNKKHESIDAVKRGRCSSKTSSEVGSRCFDDIHAPCFDDIHAPCFDDIHAPCFDDIHALLSSSNSSSEHCYTHIIQPTPVEDFFRCKGNSVTGDVVGVSVKSIKDATQNGSSCISSFALEQVSNVPSSGGIIRTELEGKRQGASDPYSAVLLNDLLNLSELLTQNISNDFDSLEEQHHDILQHVINNLYVCMKKRIEPRTSVSESAHPGTSYCPTAANDFCKGKYMGFQGTRIRAVGNAYRLGDQKEHKKQKSVSSVISDAGIKKADDVTRVIQKLMKENHETEEELHPQVLLYKNLWLEAEAALCSMKRKACVARMKTQMDGSKSD